MKRAIAILAFLTTATASLAQTLYVNTNWGSVITTFQPVNALPTLLVATNGNVTYNPSQQQLIDAGWRLVNSSASPSNGWLVTTWYVAVTNAVLGKCNLLVNTQTNIAQLIDGGFTNNPAWTANLISVAQTYRTIIDGYFGAGASSNINASDAAISAFFANKKNTGTMSTNDLQNLQVAASIAVTLRDFAGSTVLFPGG